MKVCKLLLAITCAGVLLGALASSASARRLSVSSTTMRAGFRELRFLTSEGLGPVNCPITLEGSFHSITMTKVAGSLIGFITAARRGGCIVGNATIMTETLPWHARYSSFTGTLPSIATLVTNVIGFTLRYRDLVGFGLTCTIRSTATEPLTVTYRLSAGVISGARLGGTIGTTFEECIGARFTITSDEGGVSVLGATTMVSIRLI